MDAKCGHGFRKNESNNWDISHFLKQESWFSEERKQQLGYFSLFKARELRIKDVNAF